MRKVYDARKGPIVALHGASFSVKKGEIFGILGVNGAGKSTLLNILIGVLTATSGSVRIFDKDFFKNEEAIKQRMNIATAYADLASSLSVYRNLKVFSMLYGVKDYDKRIGELLELFGIVSLKNQRFDALSAGQRTRVNLCKGLLNEPEILLLDEPTASLDPSSAAQTREILLRLQREQKTTILLTSHNMNEVEYMCDRVALLHRGEIYRIDAPEDLIKFLKVPSMEHVFLKLAQGEFEE